MANLREVFLIDAVRTPIGRHRGGLSPVRADDLAAHILVALGKRSPALYEKLDQVTFGATNQAGEDNRDVARMAALLAGLPYELPAVTVNRLCGSGLEAVCDAVRRVATGDADVAIGGGVESMTRAPFVFGKADEAFPRTPPKVFDTSLGWRFENPEDGRALSAPLDGRDRRRGRRQVEDQPRGARRLRPRLAEEGGGRDRGRGVRPRDRPRAHPPEGEGCRAGRLCQGRVAACATSRSKGSPSCRPCSARAAPSRPATALRSTTAPLACSSQARRW